MKKLRWRKELLPVIAAICCTLFFSAALQSIQSSALFTQREERFRSYGAWNCAVVGGPGVGEKAAQHLSVRRAGIMRCYTDGESGLLAGTADETAIDLGRLTLQEGTWPQGPAEIAVEAWALVKNGYSLELGQVIPVAGQPYTLCGVIRSYSQGWKSTLQTYEDVALQAVVTPDAPLASGTPVTETALLAGDYTSQESRQELKTYTGGRVCYNDPACPEGTHSPTEALVRMTDEEGAFLFLLLCCLLLTLYAVRTDRRTAGRSGTILQELGADRRQIRWYALREYAAVWGMACLPLTLLGCGAAWLALQILNRAFQAGLCFHVSIPRLLIGCAFTALSITVAAAVVPAPQQKRRARRRVCKLRKVSSLASRRLLVRLPRTVGRILCYTLILCVGVITLVQVHLQYRGYRESTGTNDYAYRFRPDGSHALLSIELLEAVEEIDGIDAVDAFTNLTEYFPQGESLRVTWEGSGSSDYMYMIKLTSDWSIDGIADSVVEVVAVNDSLWTYLCGAYGLSASEEDSAIAVFYPLIMRGGSIACIKENLERYDPGEVWKEDTLSVGDTLSIQPPGRESLSFTVGGIIRDVPADLDNARTGYFWRPTILVRSGAMEQIIGVTGYEYLYAHGDIGKMNGVFSDRQAAILAALNRAHLENNREHTVSMRDASIHHISTRTIIALLLIAFALVVLANGARSVYAADRESNTVLRALGAEEAQIRSLYRRESLIVSGISAVLSAGLLWSYWIGPEISTYSRRWGSTAAALELFVERNTAFVPGWVYGATLLALILLPIAAELLPLRREEV